MRNTRKRNVYRKRINKIKKNSSKRRIKTKRNISRRRIKTKRNITQKKINKTRNRNISRRRIKKKIIGGGFSFIPGLYLPCDELNYFMMLKDITVNVSDKTLGVMLYYSNSTNATFIGEVKLNIISYLYDGEVLLIEISGPLLSPKFIKLRRQCLNSAQGSNIRSWNIVIERIKKYCQILKGPYPKTDAEKDYSHKLVRLGIDCVRFSSGEVIPISENDQQPKIVIAKKDELVKMPEFNRELLKKSNRPGPPLFLENLESLSGKPLSTPPSTPPSTPV